MPLITSIEQLRTLYKQPHERAIKKQLPQLDRHCRRYIELSRFVIVATTDKRGGMDASPRGGEAGFVQIVNDKTLIIPDWPGNNRLDTFTNILDTGGVALLFMLAGVDEILRVNGVAQLSTENDLLERCSERNRTPKLVIVVDVHEAFLHCAKAIMRAELWSTEAQVERSVLPSMGQMLKDQTGVAGQAETQEAMVARYKEVLY